jgi:hypothetical protein
MGVQQPSKSPSVDSSFKLQNSKSSLLSSVPICTLPRRPPGGVSSLPQNTPTILSPYVHPLHLLNAHLAEPLRILSDSGLLRTHSRVLSPAPRAYAQCPPGRAPTESSVILSATVSQIHSLASKVFNNLEVFFLS